MWWIKSFGVCGTEYKLKLFKTIQSYLDQKQKTFFIIGSSVILLAELVIDSSFLNQLEKLLEKNSEIVASLLGAITGGYIAYFATSKLEEQRSKNEEREIHLTNLRYSIFIIGSWLGYAADAKGRVETYKNDPTEIPYDMAIESLPETLNFLNLSFFSKFEETKTLTEAYNTHQKVRALFNHFNERNHLLREASNNNLSISGVEKTDGKILFAMSPNDRAKIKLLSNKIVADAENLPQTVQDLFDNFRRIGKKLYPKEKFPHYLPE